MRSREIARDRAWYPSPGRLPHPTIADGRRDVVDAQARAGGECQAVVDYTGDIEQESTLPQETYPDPE